MLAADDRLADEQEEALLGDLSPEERAALIATLTRLVASAGYRAGVHPGLGSAH